MVSSSKAEQIALHPVPPEITIHEIGSFCCSSGGSCLLSHRKGTALEDGRFKVGVSSMGEVMFKSNTDEAELFHPSSLW